MTREVKFPSGRKIFLKASGGLFIGIAFGIVLLGLASFLPTNLPSTTIGASYPLKTFSSYEELKTFLVSSANLNYEMGIEDAKGGGLPPVPSPQTFSREGTSVDYSTTNIQVEGVDEADLVKTDGEYIYLASNGNVTILKAYPPNEAEIVGEIQLNGTITGIFVNDDKLAVINDQGYYYYYLERTEKAVAPNGGPNLSGPQVFIGVYDISDRSNPLLARNVTITGGYSNSRMIGDYAYVITSSSIYLNEEKEVDLPVIVENEETKHIEPTDIYYSNVTDYAYAVTIVSAIDLKNDEQLITQESFMVGYTSSVYVSLTNIYLAIPGFWQNGTQTTEVHRIRINQNEVQYEAHGSVPGYVLNQFSMDEHNEYFRIATTNHNFMRTLNAPEQDQSFEQPQIMNHVYVLDKDLVIVGKLENLAPGEMIYSARFVGTRCYLVTFKQIDPLFVIDLADPANPTVLGKLKIPGYSNYLHPYDENHLIGIGKWTVEAKEGDFAWYQGVKISIFDVTDVENPIETANITIGDRGTDSPVLYDHKALLFEKEKGLLAIPILLAEINESQYPGGVPPEAYGDYVWQGLYIFDISADTITTRGRITHIEDAEPFIKSGYYFDSQYMVQRSLYIGNALYTLSPKMIKINDLTTLEELNELELP